MANQTINLNFTPQNFQPCLYFSQGDVGRVFQINLLGIEIPSGATVTMQGTKPSGFGFTVEADSVSDGVALFTSTETMTAEAGRFPAEIHIASGSIEVGTANFLMISEKNPHPVTTIDGDAEEVIPELTLLVERVETAASKVLDMEVEAQTLSAGSAATYSYNEEENKATFGIPEGQAGAGAVGTVASAYSASKTYAVGDYAIQNGNLYRCTTAITTAESFTAAHWTQVVLGDDVTQLKSDLNLKTDFINEDGIISNRDKVLNLFDGTHAQSGFFNGLKQVADDNYFISNYFEVEPSENYYYRASAGGIFYDENFKAIQFFTNSPSTPITTPANAKYARISSGNTTNPTFAKIIGSGLAYLEWPKFDTDALSSLIAEIKKRHRGSYVLNYKSYFVQGYLAYTGEIVRNASLVGEYTQVIPCYEGEKFKYRGLGNYAAASVIFFDANQAILSYAQYNSLNADTIITVPSGAVGVVFASYGSSASGLVVDYYYEEDTTTSILNGKSIALTGDSICAGVGYAGGYGKIISDIYNMPYTNIGVGGGTIVNTSGQFCISESITNLPIADYVLLEGGVNDASRVTAVGSISSGLNATLDTTTFCGAFEKMLKDALAKYKGKKLCFIAAHKATWNWSSTKMDTYYGLAKDMCAKWGVPFCDLNTTTPAMCGIDEGSPLYGYKTDYFYQADGWHPNYDGYMQYYVPQIINFLESL